MFSKEEGCGIRGDRRASELTGSAEQPSELGFFLKCKQTWKYLSLNLRDELPLKIQLKAELRAGSLALG